MLFCAPMMLSWVGSKRGICRRFYEYSQVARDEVIVLLYVGDKSFGSAGLAVIA